MVDKKAMQDAKGRRAAKKQEASTSIAQIRFSDAQSRDFSVKCLSTDHRLLLLSPSTSMPSRYASSDCTVDDSCCLISIEETTILIEAGPKIK